MTTIHALWDAAQDAWLEYDDAREFDTDCADIAEVGQAPLLDEVVARLNQAHVLKPQGVGLWTADDVGACWHYLDASFREPGEVAHVYCEDCLNWVGDRLVCDYAHVASRLAHGAIVGGWALDEDGNPYMPDPALLCPHCIEQGYTVDEYGNVIPPADA